MLFIVSYKNEKEKIELTFKDISFIHFYAQYMPHHESFIVGNKKALLELKKMIDEALHDGEAVRDFTSSDGEDYQAFVIKVSDNDEALFESIEMPYTAQFGDDNNNTYFVNGGADINAPYSPAILLKKERV